MKDNEKVPQIKCKKMMKEMRSFLARRNGSFEKESAGGRNEWESLYAKIIYIYIYICYSLWF